MVDQELSSWTRRALSAEPLSSVVVIRPGTVIGCSVQNFCGLDAGRKQCSQKPSLPFTSMFAFCLKACLVSILEALRLRILSLHKEDTLRRLLLLQGNI